MRIAEQCHGALMTGKKTKDKRQKRKTKVTGVRPDVHT
jgi:hypothetical protein